MNFSSRNDEKRSSEIHIENLRKAKAEADMAEENLKAQCVINYFKTLKTSQYPHLSCSSHLVHGPQF